MSTREPDKAFTGAADGTGAAERLTESTNRSFPTAFSRGGTHLVFTEEPQSGSIIRMLSLEGKRTVDLHAQPMANQRNGDISPDGRWLAYQSDESGDNEIYVRPFPDVQAGRWQVSRAGGTRPLWARNTPELFYLAAPEEPAVSSAGADIAMMTAPIESGPVVRTGNPMRLFSGSYFAGVSGRTYDATPDGQRFLMIKNEATGPAATNRIIVVENWFEELKRRAPVN